MDLPFATLGLFSTSSTVSDADEEWKSGEETVPSGAKAQRILNDLRLD